MKPAAGIRPPRTPVVPGSTAWRVNRESALLLGGGRALLMQLAHPSVAAGVDEHSDFQRRPVHRLGRTLQLSLALSFGDGDQVRAAARSINQAHERVTGAGYRALDPDLLMWVMATLIDSAMVAYEVFVGPLAPREREAYILESRAIGMLLGIPAGRFPTGEAEFAGYIAAMLDGPARPDATSRRLAGAVLRPPIKFVPPFLFAPSSLLTTGLLPAPLRPAYGLAWTPWRERLFNAEVAMVRAAVRAAPLPVRVVPAARRAERLLRAKS